MLLNNYFNYIKWMMMDSSSKNKASSSSNYSITNVKRMSDNNDISTGSYFAYNNAHTSVYNAPFYKDFCKFWIGSGDTSVTSYDYDLTNDETSNFSDISENISTTIVNTDDDNYLEITYSFTGKNNTENTLILNEYGISKCFASSWNNDTIDRNSKEHNSLFIHALLESPLTVLSGETVTIVAKWRIY